MIKIKRIITLIILIIVLASAFNLNEVSASVNCTIVLSSTKAEPVLNTTFDVNISANNFSGNAGIMTLIGFLQYDSNILEIVGEPVGTAGNNITYNSSSGKIVIDRGSELKNNAHLATFTFRVKRIGDTRIRMTGNEVSNRNEDVAVNDASVRINAKEETKPTPTPTPPVRPTPTPTPTAAPTQAPTNPPVITPTPNNNQGNNNNQGGNNNGGSSNQGNNNQGSMPNGGSSTVNTNPNETNGNETQTPEITPSGATNATPTPELSR